MNRTLRLLIVWLAPFGLLYLYGLIRYLLLFFHVELLGLPSVATISGATILEVLVSPFWVLVAAGATFLFGGIVVVHLIRVFAHNKLLKRRIVISVRAKIATEDGLEKIANSKEGVKNALDEFSFVSFGKALGLSLGLNLAYTLLVQRYFQSIFRFESPSFSVINFLLLPRFIFIEFLLAIVFLPLLAIVMPLVIGKVRVRQVDNSPLQNYWLSYVYSAAGGASAVLLVLNILESRTGPKEFIIASLFIYALISWYTALGSILAIPATQKRLASNLLKLQNNDNIYFGKMFVGKDVSDLEQV